MPTKLSMRWLPIAATLALGLLATLGAGRYAASNQELRLRDDFALSVSETETAIMTRFNAYEQVLRAGVSLFLASEDVDRKEWFDFVANLRTDTHFPGIQGIGFAQRLRYEDIAAHEAAVRAEGFPEYHVHPVLPDSEPTSVVFLEPFDFRNQRAFGYNMYSQPTRRDAMARARDTGQPALSGHVTLLQETNVDRQAGTLLYLPLYEQGRPIDTVAQRRAALRGWVYSPFRMNDLMRGILGETLRDISLQLFDGTVPEPARLLFQANADAMTTTPTFTRQVQLEVAGQPWLMSVASLPGFGPGWLGAPTIIGVVGLLLTLLLSAVVASIGASEVKALALANRITGALRTAEARQRAILQHTADGIVTIDRNAIVRSFNAAAEKMFGYRATEVIGRNVSMLMPARFRPHHDAHVHSIETSNKLRELAMRREVVGRRRDGAEFPVWLAVTRMPASHECEYVGMVSDISGRKEVERRLNSANQLRESILQSSPFAILSTDAAGVIRSFNPAAERLLGYRADELIGQTTPYLLHDVEELQMHADDVSAHSGERVAPGVDSLFARAREGKTEQREWLYLRKNGEPVPVEVSITALRSPSGEVDGFLLIAYDISERKKTQAYIAHMAHHDALTGLPNRVLMQDRLQQAIEQARRSHCKVAVMMLDLDHFKRINDSLGHHVGDDLLLSVSKRLQATLRKVDTIARMGGDEFVIILPDIQATDDAERVCQQILEQLSFPMQVEHHEMIVTPSIGVCCFPDDGETIDALLKHADTAMYRAKDAGRGNFQHFEHSMLRQNERRLETENALRKALARGELSLELQPQVRLQDFQLVGSEALLRWKHPRLGQIPPYNFVPLAEEMGLIESIGEWVVHEACQQTVKAQRDLGNPDLTVAVNISPRQFFQGNLIATIDDALGASGLHPRCLEVEITEGILIKNSDQTIELLQHLREMGVRVAIDDFGTGYSSLSYITRFPIDKLKIDQSFVRDVTQDANDAAVTSAIIVMAHTLNLHVVAEGVETEAQLAFLEQRQCDIAQGYYFGRPQKLADFLKNAADFPRSQRHSANRILNQAGLLH